MKSAKPVTITLNKNSYNTASSFNVKEGDKIKLGRNSWRMAPQRIKNKQMVHRLPRKEYYPYMIVKGVASGEGEVTMTVKPYNF